jgi:hypothetical protein
MKSLNYYLHALAGCAGCPFWGDTHACGVPHIECELLQDARQIDGFMQEMQINEDQFMGLMEYLEVESEIILKDEEDFQEYVELDYADTYIMCSKDL